jgi:hypothetical protein
MCQNAQSETQSGAQSLARHDGLGSITVCSCGTILHIGGISVRMELGSFVQTAAMFEQAMKSLEHQALTLLKTPLPISTTTH